MNRQYDEVPERISSKSLYSYAVCGILFKGYLYNITDFNRTRNVTVTQDGNKTIYANDDPANKWTYTSKVFGKAKLHYDCGVLSSEKGLRIRDLSSPNKEALKLFFPMFYKNKCAANPPPELHADVFLLWLTKLFDIIKKYMIYTRIGI